MVTQVQHRAGTAGLGSQDRTLSEAEIAELVQTALASDPEFARVEGKRVLVLVPDGTRSGPIPLMFRLLYRELAGRAAALDFLIALGTHQPMSHERVSRLFGVESEAWASAFPGVHVFNHQWQEPQTFQTLGMIGAAEVNEISGGILNRAVEVRVNRLVLEYDLILVCGPVFPHEVVGFSGGNKYFFPGVSGPEVIDLSHWLGALITSYAIIGVPGVTPVRRLIDRAASMIARPKRCLAMVVAPGGADTAHAADGHEALNGLYFGTPENAWAAAAALSAQVHVRYVEKPFRRVISLMPTLYDDIWTAAKGMYKLEPVVADGGELIIYAPHISEFSYTHGKLLAELGYHVRDYYVQQWPRFAHYPGGVLAHSTHLRGIGTYNPVIGEQPRIRVSLATAISAERCAAHNVGYLDPASLAPEALQPGEYGDTLVVPRAGEILYRLAR